MINMHTEHTHIRPNGCVRGTNIRIWKNVFSFCVDSINIWPLTSSFQPTAFHNGLALFRSIKIVGSAKAYTSEDDCLDIFDSAFAMVHEWIIFDCSYDFEMTFNRRLDGSTFDVLSHSLDMQRHVPLMQYINHTFTAIPSALSICITNYPTKTYSLHTERKHYEHMYRTKHGKPFVEIFDINLLKSFLFLFFHFSPVFVFFIWSGWMNVDHSRLSFDAINDDINTKQAHSLVLW